MISDHCFKETLSPVENGLDYMSKADRYLMGRGLCNLFRNLVTCHCLLVSSWLSILSPHPAFWLHQKHHIKNLLLIYLVSTMWGEKANCSLDSHSAWAATSNLFQFFLLLLCVVACQRRNLSFIVPFYCGYLARITSHAKPSVEYMRNYARTTLGQSYFLLLCRLHFSFFLLPSHWNSLSDKWYLLKYWRQLHGIAFSIMSIYFTKIFSRA